MLRFGKERQAEALARPGAEIVEMGGVRKGDFVWVAAVACEGESLGDWLTLAESFVGALPAKG